jgi:hypothetical protein
VDKLLSLKGLDDGLTRFNKSRVLLSVAMRVRTTRIDPYICNDRVFWRKLIMTQSPAGSK